MKYKKIKWYINRLKIMSMNEICWRVNQKLLSKNEKKLINKKNIKVIDVIKGYRFYKYLKNFEESKGFLNFVNSNYSEKFIDKFWDQYSYKVNGENTWNYGFQTKNKWPNIFSYDLDYKQEDSIGDARTNWEVNRHHHLTQLAKLYYVTGKSSYVEELENDFYDWNEKNPFLMGIAWTSVMEVSIRSFSWLIILSFLEHKEYANKKFLEDLKRGILNLTEYTFNHYSRYSSANNHLIIEIVNIGIIGITFNIPECINLCNKILKKEMMNQNNEDGVNKEQSPHYQSFILEGVIIYLITCRKNNITYPYELDNILKKMCEYITDLSDVYNNIPNLGDDDCGKILDLSGGIFNHYKYVLQLGSLLFKTKYTDLEELHENVNWIFDNEIIEGVIGEYDNSKSKIYQIGGRSILKYKQGNRETVMTLDHGELGFGSIAAHGHADALSITLTVNGEEFIIDPGTYIYHIERDWRDYFRKTINHNTITVDERDQSEIKGAFLWGRRANSKLICSNLDDEIDSVECEHDGYKPVTHNRQIKYFKPDLFYIKDKIDGSFDNYISTLVLSKNIKIKIYENQFILKGINNSIYIMFKNNEEINIEEVWKSKLYSSRELTKAIRVKNSKNKELITIISINKPVTESNLKKYNLI